MSKGEVTLKAGQPATTELVSVGTDGHPSITVWTIFALDIMRK